MHAHPYVSLEDWSLSQSQEYSLANSGYVPPSLPPVDELTARRIRADVVQMLP